MKRITAALLLITLAGCHTYVYVQGEGNTTVVNDKRVLGEDLSNPVDKEKPPEGG